MAEEDKIELSANAAEIYERDFVPAMFAQWAPRLADAAQIEEGNHVLDVGCGTGVFARETLTRSWLYLCRPLHRSKVLPALQTIAGVSSARYR